jgi:hypothetical protein
MTTATDDDDDDDDGVADLPAWMFVVRFISCPRVVLTIKLFLFCLHSVQQQQQVPARTGALRRTTTTPAPPASSAT